MEDWATVLLQPGSSRQRMCFKVLIEIATEKPIQMGNQDVEDWFLSPPDLTRWQWWWYKFVDWFDVVFKNDISRWNFVATVSATGPQTPNPELRNDLKLSPIVFSLSLNSANSRMKNTTLQAYNIFSLNTPTPFMFVYICLQPWFANLRWLRWHFFHVNGAYDRK